MISTRVLVVGGGAAGFFAAITCAEANPTVKVILLEGSPQVLTKVRISGGGRCNVTHACFEPRELVQRYPRGSRELLGPFSRWQPRDTVQWFGTRGVELKTEPDGRMFPITDDSETIATCLLRAAQTAGVEVRTRTQVVSAERLPLDTGFQLTLADGSQLVGEKLLLAVGGNKASPGFTIAQRLGHTLQAQVPSLFTFNTKDPRLEGLAGLSVPMALASVVGTKLQQSGPLLVTHWGLSGPAILKLSAWGARLLAERDYRFSLQVHWLGSGRNEDVLARLLAEKQEHPKRQVVTANPWALPGRLWERLVAAAGLEGGAVWGTVRNAQVQTLAAQITAATFAIEGKSTHKDEFVTCGGVTLKEVDFKTMESRLCPGLHFAGEALDIDGVTGGFNFQAAWTTGRLAGLALAGCPAA